MVVSWSCEGLILSEKLKDDEMPPVLLLSPSIWYGEGAIAKGLIRIFK